MKHKYCIVLVVVIFFLLHPVKINSQGREETSPEQKAPVATKDLEIHDTVETLRASYLIQELQLPEEKAQSLLAKMQYTRKLRKGYLLRRYAIENELQALLDLPTPDQTKISNALQKLKIAKREYYQQMTEVDEELQEILTPEERAKYVLFQRNFNRKLKKLITSIRQQSVKAAMQQNQFLRRKDSESVIRQAR